MMPKNAKKPKRNILYFPHKILLSSQAQVQRLTIKKCFPFSIDFTLEKDSRINKPLFRKLATAISKCTFRLKNPPLKEILRNKGLITHLRKLQIKPEDAVKYIAQISYKFSKLEHFAIREEKDSFSPMKFKKKIHPMKFLKCFVYDHEFCREFMKCARYVKNLKIKKTSLDFNQLSRFKKLESIHIILK